jgi:DDE superfamily endonuclease
MGPRGPVPSLLHRDLAATPWPARRRAGRPLDRRPRGGPAAAPWPRAAARCWRRAQAAAGVLRPGGGDLGGAAPAAAAPGPGGAVRGRPFDRHPGGPRGPAAAGRPRVRRPRPAGVRLRTLADVFAYAAACGVRSRIDATEAQVRRPRAHRVGRRAFVSGKRRQNTVKTTTCSDQAGRTLWTGAVRPGRMHDQTAAKTEGIVDLLGGAPPRPGQRRRGLPGAGHGLPRPGLGPAAQAAQGRAGGGGGRLRAGAAPAVVGADLRGACHRRAQAVAVAAALDRPPGLLRRGLPGGRRAGLRPGRSPLSTPAGPVRPASPDPNRAPSRKARWLARLPDAKLPAAKPRAGGRRRLPGIQPPSPDVPAGVGGNPRADLVTSAASPRAPPGDRPRRSPGSWACPGP